MLSALCATISTILLFRDLYLLNSEQQNNLKEKQQEEEEEEGTSNKNKKKKKTKSSNTKMHEVFVSTSRERSEMIDNLSKHEEAGLALARKRSVRILLFLAISLLCVLIFFDSIHAASNLKRAIFENKKQGAGAGKQQEKQTTGEEEGYFSAIRRLSSEMMSPKNIANFCKRIHIASENNRAGTVALLFTLYLILQTFCIPGTIAVNAVFGALLGTSLALPLCVLAGTVGACCCFTLSSALGGGVAMWLDQKISNSTLLPKLRNLVNENRKDLWSLLLFLRLTPILPNWAINLLSPYVGVPMKIFAIATMIGISPQTYFAVRFGEAADQYVSSSSSSSQDEDVKIVTTLDTILLCVVGVVIVVANKMKNKFDSQEQKKLEK